MTASKKINLILFKLIILLNFLFIKDIKADLANLTKNDPYPLYSAMYPYDFLARREKIEAFYRHHEVYEEDRFRISFSAFRQVANCATDLFLNRVAIGDLPDGIGMNFGALFFDPLIARELAGILGINASITDMTSTATAVQACFNVFRDPTRYDSQRQFGFISSPIKYVKQGLRLDSEILIIDTCFDAVGFRIQAGLVDIRQTVTSFNDMTCTATPFACPAHVEPSTLPPGGSCSTTGSCCNEPCCFGFSCDCKKLMINNITSQRSVIAKFLGIDLCNTYHKIGMEDIRLYLYWRHIYNLNPAEFNEWPRVLFVPFLQVGAGIPMTSRVPSANIFGVPIGNNGHTSAGGSIGFTLDFLDTIDIAFEFGATHFFKQKYCNHPVPTNRLESRIHPYKADIIVRPGLTWYFAATLNAFHIIDNLTVWVQYVKIDHRQDKISLCAGNIPPQSAFSPENPLVARGVIPNVSLPITPNQSAEESTIVAQSLAPLSFLPAGDRGQGFLTGILECTSQWESDMLNAGFNYDISPYVSIGLAFQFPVRQRNAYRSGTILGSITMLY